MGVPQTFNPLMQLPPSSMGGPQFNGMNRGYPPTNVYSVIEGSPTYKQRRRRSSMSQGVSAAITATGAGTTHTAHRPSDLRRSMSSSVVPLAEADESQQNSPQSNGYTALKTEVFADLSRHGTPLATVEDSPVQQTLSVMPQDDLGVLTNGDGSYDPQLHHSAVARTAANGVFRRARSATMMELGPYPQKSHSCPIPTCGRLFKRLEHLKR